MTDKEKDIQKLIEAAEKSVQDGREFRTAPLASSLFAEKEAEEEKQEQTSSEWDEWGKQISSRMDDEEKNGGKSFSGILTAVGIIIAIIALSMFLMNFNSQKKTLMQKPRLNVAGLTDEKKAVPGETASKNDPGTGTGAGAETGSGNIAVHKGVPSAQAPANYKPLERDEKTGRIVRNTPKAPAEPSSTPGLTSPAPPGETVKNAPGTASPESAGENGGYQPAWMKDSPPPKAGPGGEPVLIQ